MKDVHKDYLTHPLSILPFFFADVSIPELAVLCRGYFDTVKELCILS